MAIQRPFNIRMIWLTSSLLLGLAVFLAACGSQPETSTPCPEVECPEANCPEPIAYEDLWASSGHADSRAEAFTHWDEDDPPEIPTDCAKCHSRPGFVDFLGLDGTAADQVDNPAKLGTTVTCFVCHNEATIDMSRVNFPSGLRISGLGPEAVCMQCHQGRQSTYHVNEAIAGLDADTVSEDLAFINLHYFAAGATLFGTEAKGAYEYDGKTYSGRFLRGGELFTCINCHNNHTLEVDIEYCRECHTSIKEELTDIRVDTTDYDGDGNITEGIAYEIASFQETLYVAIQVYARDVVGLPIIYDPLTHPYFFIDTNSNGDTDPDETVSTNRYNAWTPRLLQAAYNYQFASKDPGAFAHNADYVIQVLYDSLADLDGEVSGMLRPNPAGK